MAETASHAAEHDRYEVHEVLAGEPALDLGLRFETPTSVTPSTSPSRSWSAGTRGARASSAPRDRPGRGIRARDRLDLQPRAVDRSTARDLVRVWGFDPGQGWRSPYRTPPRPTPARNY